MHEYKQRVANEKMDNLENFELSKDHFSCTKLSQPEKEGDKVICIQYEKAERK